MKLIKHIIFILFFLVLLSEQIQNFKPHFLVSGLAGVVIPVEKPQLSIENWISGQYQEQLMKYYEQDMVSHAFLIRLRNQISYSLFKKINVEDILEGKNRNLFGAGYIYSYMGRDYIGVAEIDKKVATLLYVQTELKKRNIDLVFILAPGKPTILSEYLPASCDPTKKIKTIDIFNGVPEQKGKYRIIWFKGWRDEKNKSSKN